MEEKNYASDMLSQMKKIVGQVDGKPEEGKDLTSADRYTPKGPEKKPPKVRRLPSDESLFEFDMFGDPDEEEAGEQITEEAPVVEEAPVAEEN